MMRQLEYKSQGYCFTMIKPQIFYAIYHIAWKTESALQRNRRVKDLSVTSQRESTYAKILSYVPALIQFQCPYSK